MLLPFKKLGILNHDALATPRLIRAVYNAGVNTFGNESNGTDYNSLRTVEITMPSGRDNASHRKFS